MTYLRNAWYMAAWSDELGDQPLVRTVLEMPLLLYRKQETRDVVAFLDRCPHRFAPLSLGRRIGDDFQCGYHGLRFNSEGQCVYNHFAKAIPSAAKLRTFPVIEQDHMVWVWTGTGAPASREAIPRFPFHTDPALRCVFGTTLTRADYRLISDNLMDLTHTAFLHPEFGGEHYVPKCRAWEEHGSIYADHLIASMPDIFGSSGSITETDRMRWTAPSTHLLESHVTMLDESRFSFTIPSAHVLTPESQTATHYFWSSAVDRDSPLSNEDLVAGLRRAFDVQDKPMIEAVQQRMQGHELWDLSPVMLPPDAGSVLVRRALQKLIDAEAAATA